MTSIVNDLQKLLTSTEAYNTESVTAINAVLGGNFDLTQPQAIADAITSKYATNTDKLHAFLADITAQSGLSAANPLKIAAEAEVAAYSKKLNADVKDSLAYAENQCVTGAWNGSGLAGSSAATITISPQETGPRRVTITPPDSAPIALYAQKLPGVWDALKSNTGPIAETNSALLATLKSMTITPTAVEAELNVTKATGDTFKDMQGKTINLTQLDAVLNQNGWTGVNIAHSYGEDTKVNMQIGNAGAFKALNTAVSNCVVR